MDEAIYYDFIQEFPFHFQNFFLRTPYKTNMFNKKYQGLFIGILVFFVVLLLPTPSRMSYEAKSVAAIVLMMSIWWVTEAIPIYATALVPLALYPLLLILPAKETVDNYSHNHIFMMMGGFFLGKAIESQNLHKRIALVIINIFGISRKRILLSMMFATSFLSMWIANVTAVVMMFPIALSVITKDEEDNSENSSFGTAIMLGIAYSASIGGLATLIGTPTNLIFVGIMEKLFPDAPPISFMGWFKIGLPVFIVFFPVFYFFLARYFKVSGNLSNNDTIIKDELIGLGKIKKGEKRVIYICLITIFAWVFREDFVFDNFVIQGWSSLLGLDGFVDDSTVAIMAALLLFMIPANKESRLLEWKSASQIPWGVLLIVGGGYAIAAGFESTGLADWLGQRLTFIVDLPFLVVLISIIAFITIFTEFNSNTATANIMLPILASIGVAANTNPLILMIPATIAASLAFMMPAGTGPNSIVFGSNKLTVKDMMKCGIWLNLISLFLLTLILYTIVMPWLDLETTLPVWAQ
ncbi:MAG: DASS family sodium-coupled anion symporter [Saprospiraceae bacterium]|nr:DASS family sodium-coupled anion symporter [Saprospiraceae bacterium]